MRCTNCSKPLNDAMVFFCDVCKLPFCADCIHVTVNLSILCPFHVGQNRSARFCPRCGKLNYDNWLLEMPDGTIQSGGCQECWEKEAAEKWWELYTLQARIEEGETIGATE